MFWWPLVLGVAVNLLYCVMMVVRDYLARRYGAAAFGIAAIAGTGFVAFLIVAILTTTI